MKSILKMADIVHFPNRKTTLWYVEKVQTNTFVGVLIGDVVEDKRNGNMKIDPKFRRSLILKLGGRPKSNHKPGDVWKTTNGFRAMNPKGVAKTFKTQEEAKVWSKSEGKGKKEKTPPSVERRAKYEDNHRDIANALDYLDLEETDEFTTPALDTLMQEGPKGFPDPRKVGEKEAHKFYDELDSSLKKIESYLGRLSSQDKNNKSLKKSFETLSRINREK